eukprot:jgi/Antlo1/80/1359
MSPVRVLVGNFATRGKKADFFILENEKARLEDVHEVAPGICIPSYACERDTFNLTGVREDLENAISRFLEGIDNVDGIVVVAECCYADVLLAAVETLRDQCPRTRIELQITGEVKGDMSYVIELTDCVIYTEEEHKTQ